MARPELILRYELLKGPARNPARPVAGKLKQTADKCKQTAEKCKHAADKCKQAAGKFKQTAEQKAIVLTLPGPRLDFCMTRHGPNQHY